MNELVWRSQYVGLLGGQGLSKVESDKLARPSARAPSTCGGEGRRMGRPAIDRGPKFVNPGNARSRCIAASSCEAALARSTRAEHPFLTRQQYDAKLQT